MATQLIRPILSSPNNSKTKLFDLVCKQFQGIVATKSLSKYRAHFVLTEESVISLHQHEKIQLNSFDELFFDTIDYILLRKNYWLRRRNDTWSLKYQVSNNNNVLEYEEISNNDEIMKKLSEIIPDAKPPTESDRVSSYCSNCYAEFSTLRYQFLPNDNRLDWWVDVTYFGDDGPCKFFVTATIEGHPGQVQTTTSTTATIEGHPGQIQTTTSTTLKQLYCLEYSAPSKIIAYLYKRKPQLLGLIKKDCNDFSSCFLAENPLRSKALVINAFIEYAFRPGTEDFWGEPIDCPTIDCLDE